MTMKKIGHYIPVVIGVVMVLGALFLTGGFFAAPPAVFQEGTQVPSETTTTAESESSARTVKRVPIAGVTRSSMVTSTSYEGTTEVAPTTTTKASTSKTSTSTTKKTSQRPYQPYSGGRFSKLIVFLDIQRIVFYTTDPDTGADVPAYAVRCSTGKPGYATPTTGPGRYYRLSGRKAVRSKFSSLKSPDPCWVRYATHLAGSIYFHSIPLDYYEGRPIDYSKSYVGGYNRLLAGETSSHGCIRMALRDAKFLYEHTYRGMPVYVLSSSKGYQLAPAQPLPKHRNPRLGRDWDPTDWNSPYYKPLPTVATTTPKTTTAASVTTGGGPASSTVTTATGGGQASSTVTTGGGEQTNPTGTGGGEQTNPTGTGGGEQTSPTNSSENTGGNGD